MCPTKTTPKPSKLNHIHPLTPDQTHEPSSVTISPMLPRRSPRLASGPNSEPLTTPDSTLRVSTRKGKGKTKPNGEGKEVKVKGFLNLRSGKQVLKGRITDSENSRKRKKDENEKGDNGDINVDDSLNKSHVNNEGGSSRRRILSREEKGKAPVIVDDDDELGEESEMEDSGINHSIDNKVLKYQEKSKSSNTRDNCGGSKRNGLMKRFCDIVRENASIAYFEDENGYIASSPEPDDLEQSRNSNAGENSGFKRNGFMERFRDIARENASRFAHFEPDENCYVASSPEPEIEQEIEDWPGPFSTAMKIIKDRETKGLQTGSKASQTNLIESIAWVPRMNQGSAGETRFSVPSLQELSLKVLAQNADAIVSLKSVPDALRHRLSQMLCDSRRINNHFFELLVRGTPTEIRLRDCSWLTEDQFTKCFQMCDTSNLVVLQLDQCGRCLPDYVVVATLAQSPRQLPRLISLSLTGACRLSDGGLRALVSSARALRSINLSQCSLLTSASVYILAESLKSLLKELYLDDCQGIDAALILPALVELEHLEVLSVAGIQTVDDKFVKDYIVARDHNMKELVLKNCINLTDASIKVIAEHCPGLCVLDLTNLSKLTDLSIGYLTNGCRALHTLKLCRNPFSDEAIAAFVETTGGSLKELSLNNIKKVGYHTTLSLASHAKNLHSLDLSWCRNLADNAMGLIVDSCSKLRLLKLFGCTQVTNVFLNGHSNLQIQIIGLKLSPVLQHVKVPDPHQGALTYSSVAVDMV